mmetsp:Transcript_139243/g.277632  ORF Transcript_139243/g.277632 Transcript_139243/m.277632 type:complete len:239 (-) Transcript_139243:298-1014(-)
MVGEQETTDSQFASAYRVVLQPSMHLPGAIVGDLGGTAHLHYLASLLHVFCSCVQMFAACIVEKNVNTFRRKLSKTLVHVLGSVSDRLVEAHAQESIRLLPRAGHTDDLAAFVFVQLPRHRANAAGRGGHQHSLLGHRLARKFPKEFLHSCKQSAATIPVVNTAIRIPVDDHMCCQCGSHAKHILCLQEGRNLVWRGSLLIFVQDSVISELREARHTLAYRPFLAFRCDDLSDPLALY